MTMTDRSIAMGVFEDSTLAQRAIDELRQAGFGDDHIGFAVRNNPLVEAEVSAPGTEKQYVVVMVRTEDRQQEALDVLRRCGASHAGDWDDPNIRHPRVT
jgi:hypothetical protein